MSILFNKFFFSENKWYIFACEIGQQLCFLRGGIPEKHILQRPLGGKIYLYTRTIKNSQYTGII